uniref:Uncharacterized protein n=1 Tax=Romanomermis culicivorax TaxID=13658 RepID=A0A915K010_ROMCU
MEETMLAEALLDNLTECEKERLEKLPDWQEYYTVEEMAEKLKGLCNMAKAWDLTAKLNIPQLTDPSFDPQENPIKLNLLPQQRSYIESKGQCEDSASCFNSLTKPTLRVKVKSMGGNQTGKRKL